ncbi:hypothetical protein CYD30_20815 [Kosakonia cowanii]|nr:hypothetical protein CYD30_20815 [Kosakonia cowanii]
MQPETEYHNTSATPYRLGQIRLAARAAAFRRACRQRLADSESVSQVELTRLRAAVTEAEQALQLIERGGEIEQCFD